MDSAEVSARLGPVDYVDTLAQENLELARKISDLNAHISSLYAQSSHKDELIASLMQRCNAAESAVRVLSGSDRDFWLSSAAAWCINTLGYIPGYTAPPPQPPLMLGGPVPFCDVNESGTPTIPFSPASSTPPSMMSSEDSVAEKVSVSVSDPAPTPAPVPAPTPRPAGPSYKKVAERAARPAEKPRTVLASPSRDLEAEKRVTEAMDKLRREQQERLERERQEAEEERAREERARALQEERAAAKSKKAKEEAKAARLAKKEKARLQREEDAYIARMAAEAEAERKKEEEREAARVAKQRAEEKEKEEQARAEAQRVEDEALAKRKKQEDDLASLNTQILKMESGELDEAEIEKSVRACMDIGDMALPVPDYIRGYDKTFYSDARHALLLAAMARTLVPCNARPPHISNEPRITVSRIVNQTGDTSDINADTWLHEVAMFLGANGRLLRMSAEEILEGETRLVAGLRDTYITSSLALLHWVRVIEQFGCGFRRMIDQLRLRVSTASPGKTDAFVEATALVRADEYARGMATALADHSFEGIFKQLTETAISSATAAQAWVDAGDTDVGLIPGFNKKQTIRLLENLPAICSRWTTIVDIVSICVDAASSASACLAVIAHKTGRPFSSLVDDVSVTARRIVLDVSLSGEPSSNQIGISYLEPWIGIGHTEFTSVMPGVWKMQCLFVISDAHLFAKKATEDLEAGRAVRIHRDTQPANLFTQIFEKMGILDSV